MLQALDEDERAEWVTELEKCRDFSDSGNGIEVEDLEMEDIGDYVCVHHTVSRILDFLFGIVFSRNISRSAHQTPHFANPEYFVCLLFEYFFQI